VKVRGKRTERVLEIDIDRDSVRVVEVDVNREIGR
jgi:hypothetical protein